MPSAAASARLAIVLASWGVTLLGGCNSGPTLPLPPPEALAEAPDDAGRVTVHVSAVPAGAIAQAYNVDTGRGVIATAPDSGEVDLQLQGETGDELQVWYRQGTETSELKTVFVPSAGDAGVPPDGG